MIFSQAVLEHVEDLLNTYKAMNLWLKPAGYVSHTIDFQCHGTADEWNGHWTHSDLMWKIIKGKWPFLLNREPHSRHIAFLQEHGFRIVADRITTVKSNINKEDLAQKFRYLTEEDLITTGSFIQAIKLSRETQDMHPGFFNPKPGSENLRDSEA
ncbi:MAG: hypothetical protein JWQ21_1879 [Herminiimonas sp.]|nr:hypothetical protein [Herminiimonas sp.]